jgi:acid stress-induced BolA-like protein IbaG/YrbA
MNHAQIQRRCETTPGRGEEMVEAAWVESEVLKAVPDAIVEVIDLHGSGDHFHVRVISESFEGLRPLQRQKQVLAVMKAHIPHPVHALDLKCMTPAQAETAGDTAFDPHGGGQGVHIRRIQRNQE